MQNSSNIGFNAERPSPHFGYEGCRRNLEKLIEYYEKNKSNRNEASTRFHLIDRLFFECLDWSKSDMEPEKSHEGEYADYVFSAPRQVLIVEAKREGNYFELPSGEKSRIERSLTPLIRDNDGLRQAIRQVAGYCQSRGVPLGCVCNGHQLVVFIATRQDGEAPLEGNALVFYSLQSMLDNFLDFWNALSRHGIQDKNLQNRLAGVRTIELPQRLSAILSNYPGAKSRNVFQTDLQIFSELVIEDITRTREIEAQFLRECYSASGALSQYAFVSKKILETRYAAIFGDETPQPLIQPAVNRKGISSELLAESLSRRPILLIGDVGVGKTTFIRNLIKVEAVEVFSNAITLYIDLGSQATLTDDIKAFVLTEIERQLKDDYDINIRADNVVRGVFNRQLLEFDEGIYGRFKETNTNLFLEKQVEYLHELVSDRQSYLRQCLHHISRGRNKQVVIFLDNVDQRDEHTQQVAFLISQEVAEHWSATIFVTLRPETYHRSLRIGALSGYHPKAFTISPPRVTNVIEKRLQFALKLTSGEIPIQQLSGIKVNLEKLDIVIRALLSSIRKNEELAEAIDNISGGNVRLALEFVRGFLGSGHVDTQKIYDKQISGGYVIPLHEFLRAVIFGDTVYYDPDKSPVANLYDISHADPKEHFLLPLLIELVSSLGDSGTDEGFVSTSEIYSGLQSLGFTPDQIDVAVVRAQRKNLIETAARRIPQPGQPMPDTMRITTVGKYHSVKLLREFAYLDAMVVDTPILNRDFREQILDVFDLQRRLERAEIFRRYLDDQWRMGDLKSGYFRWPAASSELREQIASLHKYTLTNY